MDSLSREILKGLNSKPKYLPEWYEYDEEGSRFYDETLQNSAWWYNLKYEVELLRDVIKNDEFLQMITPYRVLVDLGCGNAYKTRLFLDKLVEKGNKITYVPVDVSEAHLHKTSDDLLKEYDDKIVIDRMPMDYFEALENVSNRHKEDQKLIVWFSGPMNFPYQEQIRHLSKISSYLNAGDRLLITVDITSPDQKKIIELAYNDPEGYINRLSFNHIRRLNKDFQGNIDVSKFQMKNEFIANTSPTGCSYVNKWFEPIEDCCFYLEKLNKRLEFKKDEKFYIHDPEGGVTSKYSTDQIKNIFHQSSLKIENYWTNQCAAVFILYK